MKKHLLCKQIVKNATNTLEENAINTTKCHPEVDKPAEIGIHQKSMSLLVFRKTQSC